MVIVKDIASWCNIIFDNDYGNPLLYAHHLYSDEKTEITNLVIPDSVTSIGKAAFTGCSSLTSVTIPNSVTSIGGSAFNKCSSLTSVTIPNLVTSIGEYAFLHCSSLTSVTIGNSVTSIGSKAFYDCSELIKVSIGSGIKNIGDQVFANCPKIEDVYCYAVRYPTTATNAFSSSYPDYITLHVPENSVTQYKSASPWNTFYDVVPLDYNATEIPGAPKCAKPTISYVKGQLVMNCATEGVEYITDITDTDIKQHHSSTITLSATYEIRVFAIKQGYNNSEIATATLCWIEVDPQKIGFTEDDPTDAKQLKAMPMLIQAAEGQISVEGAPEGTKVAVYDASGMEMGAAISRGGTTLIPTHLASGSIAIVKIGEKAVKVAVK